MLLASICTIVNSTSNAAAVSTTLHRNVEPHLPKDSSIFNTLRQRASNTPRSYTEEDYARDTEIYISAKNELDQAKSTLEKLRQEKNEWLQDSKRQHVAEDLKQVYKIFADLCAGDIKEWKRKKKQAYNKQNHLKEKFRKNKKPVPTLD
ncbi:hypothetical protein BC835DRAFT_1422560 [Cytidiella melzeri]|nr:hypothetical protein BC835DRAFT_1422560 [Cytidiella melzeri]